MQRTRTDTPPTSFTELWPFEIYVAYLTSCNPYGGPKGFARTTSHHSSSTSSSSHPLNGVLSPRLARKMAGKGGIHSGITYECLFYLAGKCTCTENFCLKKIAPAELILSSTDAIFFIFFIVYYFFLVFL